jgi:hypothetical protein
MLPAAGERAFKGRSLARSAPRVSAQPLENPKLSALNPAQRATGICYSSNICCDYFKRYIELCFGIALQVV